MIIRRFGDKTLSVPGFMSILPQHIIDVLLSDHDASQRIVSCGVDPDDGCLYMVTARLQVCVLSPNGGLRPTSACPYPDGRTLGVTFQGDNSLHRISSLHALRRSRDCLAGGRMVVNDTYSIDVGPSNGGDDEDNTR